MVVRGRIRGNGSQLANYLLKTADNDNVRVFDIRGTSQQGNLRKSLLEMSLTSELTKSDKGLYHVQICPAYGEDKSMTDADWLKAADIMEHETGYSGQKRAIVLHDKKGKIHAHVVWERYDHEKGIMKPDKYSRLAQDRARGIMEREFEQEKTPERNRHQPEMKEYLTEIWQTTESADAFITAIAGEGYAIAAGTQRPYMVVDHTGRSFDLVRQLEGIRTKAVRERFKSTKLVKEKQAIENVRTKQKAEKVVKLPVKSVIKRENLKAASNDNIWEITTPTNPVKSLEKTYTMKGTFSIDGQAAEKSVEQLKAAVAAMDEKQAQKQKILDELKRQRIEKAKQFRENERDL